MSHVHEDELCLCTRVYLYTLRPQNNLTSFFFIYISVFILFFPVLTSAPSMYKILLLVLLSWPLLTWDIYMVMLWSFWCYPTMLIIVLVSCPAVLLIFSLSLFSIPEWDYKHTTSPIFLHGSCKPKSDLGEPFADWVITPPNQVLELLL